MTTQTAQRREIGAVIRAYSEIETKAVGEEARVITGTATTPSADRMGDIVEPLGVQFKNPLPLLWQHRHDEPIGWVTFDKPTKAGITFTATLAKIAEPGMLRDRVEEAWQSLKYGLVRAFSIGFVPIEYSWMDDGGVRFIQAEVIELSAVTIPANAECTLESIKSIDRQALATSGREGAGGDRHDRPQERGGAHTQEALGKPSKPTGKPMNKQLTLAEQIASYETMRTNKATRMDEIQDAVVTAGRTKDAAEREEYETLEGEVASLDLEIRDLKAREARNVAGVVEVRGQSSAEGSASRSTEDARQRAAYGSVVLQPKVEKGIVFTRLLGAKYLAMINHCAPWDIAKRWSDTPEVEAILRAAVAPGSTTDPTFASALVQLNTATGDFVDMLRAKEIIGRIAGLDRIPFNTQVPRGTQDPTAYWVGQGDVKPLSRPAFDLISLTFAKVAGIVPMTEELMKFSNPSAEVKVRDGLIAALAYLTDRDFLDPAKTASTGISPASITNGVTPTTASGTDADAFRADFGDMLADFAEANEDMTGLVLVMTTQQATRLSLMRNALGQKEFPDIRPIGGEIEGFPVVTSTNVAATGGSPTDGYPIVAINAPNIYLAEEGVTVDISREASLQMTDTPDSPETASTVLVNLWQRNMAAIKAERYITWLKKHSSSVQFIQNAKYA